MRIPPRIIHGRAQDGSRDGGHSHQRGRAPGKGHEHGSMPVHEAPACPRQSLRNLTPDARRRLYQKIQAYIASPADPVQQHLDHGHVHGSADFLPWHRGFLNGFEEWQRAQARSTTDQFVPLAYWDLDDELPLEFRDPSIQTIQNRNPPFRVLPVPPGLRLGQGLETLTFTAFQRLLEDEHHNPAHGQIGPVMADPRTSPRDPTFWIFHAFYDHLFADWQMLNPAP